MGLLDSLRQLFRPEREAPSAPAPPERGDKTIEEQGQPRGLGETEGYEPRPGEREA